MKRLLPLLLVALLTLLTAGPVQSAPLPENVSARGSLANSRLQFEEKKTGRVAFLGGSITEMEGYRPMVMENLKKRFPGTQFQVTAAGISSTCSTTGAFRVGSQVLEQGPVDLFFVEFAVNDDQDAAHSRAECIRGLEGIVRQVRRSNPKADIVVTFFVNEGMLAALQAGKTPLTIEAHDAVAAHYQVPSIHLAREVAARISAGTLSWKQYGGVHPAPYGNAICADLIESLLQQEWAAPIPAGAAAKPHAMPAEPLDAFNYDAGRFLPIQSAHISPAWSVGVPDWKALPGSKRERFTSMPMLSATEPGAELSLKFEGRAVGAYVVAGPDAGVVETSVDGAPFVALDLFHQHSAGLHYPRTVLFAAELSPGAHTLILRISAQTPHAGHAVRIMEFVAN